MIFIDMESNLLIGKWQTIRWAANAPGEWQSIGEFTHGLSTWEFSPDETLLDQFDGETPELLTYRYDSDLRLLIIQRFEVEERYRVEFSTQNHILLYDLEGVEVEPDDYALRIEMERLSTGSK